MNNKKKLIIVGVVVALFVIIGLFFLLQGNKNEKPTYQVSFDSNGGTLVSNVTIEEGQKVVRPLEPTKEGYIFVEWQLDGKTYDFNLTVTKDIVLTAVWVEKQENTEMVVVRFNTDGGTTISNQIIEKGSKVKKPNDPVKDGYIFKGWTLNDAIYDFGKNVESDVELKAKWEKKTYTVTFNSDGGSNVSSKTVTEGNKVSKPSNPTKEGYTFVEWQLDGRAYDFNSKVIKSIELKAVWKKVNTYTVTFDSDGGSSVSSKTVTEGTKVSKPSNPTKEGYTFVEWQLDGRAYDFNNSVNGNITLVAKWSQRNYVVEANAVDQMSPFSRILTVYEDGKEITVKTIQYSDGVTICSGANPNVNYHAIKEETTLTLVLNSGTIVTASLKIN